MRSLTKTMAVLSCLLAPNALAGVEVNLGDSIDIIAYNGEEVGMRVSPLRHLELNNGTNQIAIRMSKLVQKSDGQFEKYNSPVSIVTFSAENQTITLSPAQKVKNVKDADSFSKSPIYTLNTEGEIAVTQELLPRGSGLTRDYEKEIARYNSKRNIRFEKEIIHTPFSSKENLTIPEYTDSPNINKIKQDFLSLPTLEQKEFLKWAVSQ